jgi:hypothetical protein
LSISEPPREAVPTARVPISARDHGMGERERGRPFFLIFNASAPEPVAHGHNGK